jgi:hypothetical protein
MNYDFRKTPPLSLQLLKEWAHNNYGISQPNISGRMGVDKRNGGLYLLGEVFNPLELQFFFDEQGIMGYMDCFWEKPFDVQDWSISIEKYQENNGFYFQKSAFSSRSEALTALFDKCFDLLEQKLTEHLK